MIDLEGSSLVLMVTLGCTCECAHCCLASGRDKLRLRLSSEEMRTYIEEADKGGIRSVVFTGGEPAVYLEDLYGPMVLARDLGMYVDLRTNGFWAGDRDGTHGTMRRLRESGLQRLGLSFDKFHAKHIARACVTNAIEAAQNLGVEVYLDWIGNETRDEVARYLEIDEAVVRMVGPPVKVGRAKRLANGHFALIPIEEVEHCSEYSQSCGGNNGSDGSDGSLLLTVFPRRHLSLHPCCWVNPALVRQQAANGDWLTRLVEDMAYDPVINFLSEHGIGGLIGLAREESPQLLKPYYSHQCEACFDILKELTIA